MTGSDPGGSSNPVDPADPVDEIVEAREALVIEELAHELRRAKGFRFAARRALELARRYRFEEGPRGERELACVKQALAWRATAADLRRSERAKVEGQESQGPGIARTSVPPPSAGRRAG